jgi:NAD(P)-dependent dehydrogenase (short-subunit alcohol dehydrogenase family)
MGLPDQTGKVVVVTGANTGIGKETARALAKAGATVVITSRNEEKGNKAAADIGGDVHLVLLDLASLAAVRKAAEEIVDRWDRLDVLVNNAGALIGEQRLTDDGFELTIGANHLGPFLLTNLLLDRLKASAPARVVNLASIAHRGANRVDMDAAVDVSKAGRYNPMGVYGESKLANVLFTKELAKRVAGTGVTTYAVHPGGVRSEFGKGEGTGGLLALGVMIIRPFEISPATGASASLYCATAPGIEDRSGGYFQKKLFGNIGPVTEVEPTSAAKDAAAATQLWDRSAALVGL